MSELRTCKHCGQTKPITAFRFHRLKGNVYRVYKCRQCTNAADKARKAKRATEAPAESNMERLERISIERCREANGMLPVGEHWPMSQPPRTMAEAQSRYGRC